MRKDRTIMLIIFIFIICSFFIGENENYPIKKDFYFRACSDFETDILDCNKEFQYFIESYAIYPKEQIVVEKSSFMLTKLHDCMIFDENNWSCIKDFAAPEYRVSVINGHHEGIGKNTGIYANASYYSYSWYKMKSFFSSIVWFISNIKLMIANFSNVMGSEE